jgi:signal transduction histidine kinase
VAAVTTDRVVVLSLPEALARTLRHEMGDFLQKVYASVAILEGRLPADAKLERDLLTRLRDRAESCKNFLDTVQDFFCSLSLNRDPVDLSHLARQLVDDARRRFPRLDIAAESNDPAWLAVDFDRMRQVGEALLTNACEAARSRVVFRTETDPAGQQVEWCISDDGPGVAPEVKGYLFRPFFTTRSGHAGLGLAMAQKLVALHGGQILAANLPHGGFSARVLIPSAEITQTILLNEGDTKI